METPDPALVERHVDELYRELAAFMADRRRDPSRGVELVGELRRRGETFDDIAARGSVPRGTAHRWASKASGGPALGAAVLAHVGHETDGAA